MAVEGKSPEERPVQLTGVGTVKAKAVEGKSPAERPVQLTGVGLEALSLLICRYGENYNY